MIYIFLFIGAVIMSAVWYKAGFQSGMGKSMSAKLVWLESRWRKPEFTPDTNRPIIAICCGELRIMKMKDDLDWNIVAETAEVTAWAYTDEIIKATGGPDS